LLNSDFPIIRPQSITGSLIGRLAVTLNLLQLQEPSSDMGTSFRDLRLILLQFTTTVGTLASDSYLLLQTKEYVYSRSNS
jgi:hypothetical protein